MKKQGLEFRIERHPEKISSTTPRVAELKVDGLTTSIVFVQHSGKFFSWSKWHDYLCAKHPGLMEILNAEYHDVKPSRFVGGYPDEMVVVKRSPDSRI